MSIPAQSGIPSIIGAGDTLRFTLGNTIYPATTHTLQFVLNLNGGVAVVSTATASGRDHIVHESALTTAAWSPGRATWVCYFVEIASGERVKDGQGEVSITPNFAISQVETVLQKLLRQGLEMQSQIMTGGAHASGSWNGQSWSSRNLGEMQTQIDRLRRQVSAEQRSLGYITRQPRNIQVQF